MGLKSFSEMSEEDLEDPLDEAALKFRLHGTNFAEVLTVHREEPGTSESDLDSGNSSDSR